MIDDTGLFDVIDINESIQGSSGNMPATKKEKLHINTQQVDGTEPVHTLWPMKFFPNANLFSLTFKVLQGKKISRDHQNNIMVESTDGDIILDCQIKTHNGWVVGVKFLQETSEKRAQSATTPHKKISVTSMLNLVIHPSQSPVPPLKPWVSKSPVSSNCVTLCIGQGQTASSEQEGCCLIKNFGRLSLNFYFLW